MSLTVSLNELEFMTRKAFRGAGYHWGEAEEAGKAAVWLARRGLPVLAPVLDLLHHAPEQAGSASCPLRTGLRFADGVTRLEPGAKTVVPAVRAPLLLLPFLAECAAGRAQNLSVRWTGNASILHGGDLHIEASDAMTAEPVNVEIAATAFEKPPGPVIVADHRSLTVEPLDWEVLGRFAAATYVPASARSRLAGAGAGVTDND